MEELDNIANTTSFNGKQLLSGGFTNQEFQIGSSSNQTIKASIGATQSSKIGVTRFETGSQSFSSGTVGLTIKNYNGIEDFKFQNVVISTSVVLELWLKRSTEMQIKQEFVQLLM